MKTAKYKIIFCILLSNDQDIKNNKTKYVQVLQYLVGPLWHMKVLLKTSLFLTSPNSQVYNQPPLTTQVQPFCPQVLSHALIKSPFAVKNKQTNK